MFRRLNFTYIIICIIALSGSPCYAQMAPVPITHLFSATSSPPVPSPPPEFNATFVTKPSQADIVNKKIENIIKKDDNSNIKPVANIQAEPPVPGRVEERQEFSLYVKNILVEGSELLTDKDLNPVISKYEDRTLTVDELKEAVKEINNIYLDYGILTALAYLPPQDIADNTVIIKVVEGKVGKIEIQGNKHTRESYLRSVLGQNPGDVLYLPEIKKNISTFNQNNDIRLKARIRKGEVFGTSDISLEVEEKNPYHLGFTFDNYGREYVGVHKGMVQLEDDSLLGYRDKLSVSYGRARSTNIVGTTYSFPIGTKGLRIGGAFGYGDMAVTRGPYADMNVEGKSFIYTGFITKPIINTPRFMLSTNLAFNAKNTSTTLYNGRISSPKSQIRSLTASISAVERDKTGQWIHNSDFDIGVNKLGGQENFFKYTASLIRLQKLGFGSMLILRAIGQAATEDLPVAEYMTAGGATSVRGYLEGVTSGRYGYIASSELRYPLIFLPKNIWGFKARERIQGAIFADTGGVIGGVGPNPHLLAGAGAGLRINLTKYLTGRVDYGFSFINKPDEQSSCAKLHFSVDSNPF